MADGKTSPFGNGRGGERGMATRGVDFTREPGGGGGAGGARPRDLTKSQVPARRSVQPTDISDMNTESVPEGGLLPFEAPKPDAGNPIGVGSLGNGAKPFRLDGGG